MKRVGRKTEQIRRYEPITFSRPPRECSTSNLTNNITVIKCNKSRYQECALPLGTLAKVQSMLFVLGNFSPLGKLSSSARRHPGPSCSPLAVPGSPHPLNAHSPSSWSSSPALEIKLPVSSTFQSKLQSPQAG